GEGDSLADADAHGRETKLAAAALELLGRGQREARAGHSERVPKGDRAAVWVHVLGVIGKAELAEHGQTLCGERLIQLDHIEIGDLVAEPLHQFFRSRSRTDAHDPGWNPGDRSPEYARP